MTFWLFVTRLGEAQILLPAALMALLWLAHRSETRPQLWAWMLAIGLAATLTTASKVAFIGFELGVPQLNFTGISGHAMFAAAIYPLLFGVISTGAHSPTTWRVSVGCAYALALLIGISRWVIHAHSASEVVAGLCVGGAASALALSVGHLPQARHALSLALGLALWLVVMPIQAPVSRTHDWVTRLSLVVADREAPYTREKMLRDWRRHQQGAAAPARHANLGFLRVMTD